MKTTAKKILIVSIVVVIVIASSAFTVLYYYPRQSPQSHLKTYIIIQPENSIVVDAQTPLIPINETSVMAEAEHASLSKRQRR